MKDLFGDRWEVQLKQQRLARERWEEIQLDENAGERIPGGKCLLGGSCSGSRIPMRKEEDPGAAVAQQEKSVPLSADAYGPAEGCRTTHCGTRREGPARGLTEQGVREELGEQEPKGTSEKDEKEHAGTMVGPF